jgi:hypothetical protein
MNYATELISLIADTDYSPTFIRTDRRIPNGQPTTLGYYQIGADQQYGNAKGPIFKVEFADTSSIATATHVKIWGLDNDDTNAPLYPITYIVDNRPMMELYLKKFIFCDSEGIEVNEEGNYTVIGYKRRSLPQVL